MAKWERLSADTAHALYRVPLEQAAASRNEFYGIGRDPRDADSPRPLLALLRHSEKAAVVTLQVYTIEAEERSVAALNPLERPCGYLSLDREALAGLVSILDACAGQLPLSGSGARPMFRKLADAELQRFGLSPDWPWGAGDKHYAQVRDPLTEREARCSEAVLILSSSGRGPRSRLYFKIAHFHRHALDRPNFDVLDDSLARIQLDRDGTRELSLLLEAQFQGMAA